MITAHGLGATPEHPMNVMEFLVEQHLPVLNLFYRGDQGAPRPPDGLGHLGDSEWRDLDAAIRFAVRGGAEYVILYGWSVGATMALHAAGKSGQRDRIKGLVLDSPVLDWEATLRAMATARRTPGPLLPLAVRAAQGRTGLRGGRLPVVADPGKLDVPTLIVHGPDDALSPWYPSRELAARRTDLVTLHTVSDAPHGAMWNADPTGYEETLRRFLTPSCDPSAPSLTPARDLRRVRPPALLRHPRPPSAPASSRAGDRRVEVRAAGSVWAFGQSAGRLLL